ncbi:MAG: ABC transporter transmembrane domain-containing protein [Bacillota bacterium]|nr:ABC transporter transmembrane domain-containing protein [Bacillota bacterium]HHU30559.1 ABC transporter ATP-binding protein [Bacillota bacterium]
MDYAELERRHSGALINNSLPGLFFSIISMIFTLVYLFFISWRVIILGLILGPIILFLASVMGKPLGEASRKYQENLAGVNALAQDATGGIAISKAFLLKNYLSTRFRSRAVSAAKAAVDLAYLNGRLQAVMPD